MSRLGDNNFPGISGLLRHVLPNWARRTLKTSLPGTIVSYDSTTKLAEVRPVIGKGANIRGVPVLFPGNSDGIFEFPLQAGDRVWIIWSKFDLALWIGGGYAERKDTDGKLFTYQGCVALPWGQSDTNLLDQIGVIAGYDSSTKLAEVRPSMGGGVTIRDVPVLFPGTEREIFEFPLEAGDRVQIIWTKSDGISTTPNGAVCIPVGQGTINLLDRLLPEGGSAGQVVKRTSTGYEWGTDQTG